jgi:hypothetical protein
MKNSLKFLFLTVLFYQCTDDIIDIKEVTFEEVWLSNKCQEQVEKLNSIYIDKDLTLHEKTLEIRYPFIEIRNLLKKYKLEETVTYKDVDKAWKKYNNKPSVLTSKKLKYTAWSPISRIDQCAIGIIRELNVLRKVSIEKLEMTYNFHYSSQEIQNDVLQSLSMRRSGISGKIDIYIGIVTNEANHAHMDLQDMSFNNPDNNELDPYAEWVINDFVNFARNVLFDATGYFMFTAEPDFNPSDDGGGSAGNTDPDPDPLPEVLPSPEFTNSKAGCVYDKLKNLRGGFAKAIKKFDGEFPVSHLKFMLADLGSSRGKTIAPNSFDDEYNSPDYTITIVLNNNWTSQGIDSRPNLLVAKTIAHEVIHAEMWRKLMSLAKKPNFDGYTPAEMLDKLKNKDYPGIYDYFRRFNGKGWQHQQMATHYRETIADILQKFDNNQHSRQFYMDIAWEGLIYEDIYTWISQSEQEKNRIKKVISDYIEANKNQPCR